MSAVPPLTTFPIISTFCPVKFSLPHLHVGKKVHEVGSSSLNQQIIYFFLLRGTKQFALFDRHGGSFKGCLALLEKALILKCLNRFLDLNRIGAFTRVPVEKLIRISPLGIKGTAPLLLGCNSDYPLFLFSLVPSSHHQDSPRINLNCKTVVQTWQK